MYLMVCALCQNILSSLLICRKYEYGSHSNNWIAIQVAALRTNLEWSQYIEPS